MLLLRAVLLKACPVEGVSCRRRVLLEAALLLKASSAQAAAVGRRGLARRRRHMAAVELTDGGGHPGTSIAAAADVDVPLAGACASGASLASLCSQTSSGSSSCSDDDSERGRQRRRCERSPSSDISELSEPSHSVSAGSDSTGEPEWPSGELDELDELADLPSLSYAEDALPSSQLDRVSSEQAGAAPLLPAIPPPDLQAARSDAASEDKDEKDDKRRRNREAAVRFRQNKKARESKLHSELGAPFFSRSHSCHAYVVNRSVWGSLLARAGRGLAEASGGVEAARGSVAAREGCAPDAARASQAAFLQEEPRVGALRDPLRMHGGGLRRVAGSQRHSGPRSIRRRQPYWPLPPLIRSGGHKWTRSGSGHGVVTGSECVARRDLVILVFTSLNE